MTESNVRIEQSTTRCRIRTIVTNVRIEQLGVELERSLRTLESNNRQLCVDCDMEVMFDPNGRNDRTDSTQNQHICSIVRFFTDMELMFVPNGRNDPTDSTHNRHICPIVRFFNDRI